jgi:hypothetical protein
MLSRLSDRVATHGWHTTAPHQKAVPELIMHRTTLVRS